MNHLSAEELASAVAGANPEMGIPVIDIDDLNDRLYESGCDDCEEAFQEMIVAAGKVLLGATTPGRRRKIQADLLKLARQIVCQPV